MWGCCMSLSVFGRLQTLCASILQRVSRKWVVKAWVWEESGDVFFLVGVPSINAINENGLTILNVDGR